MNSMNMRIFPLLLIAACGPGAHTHEPEVAEPQVAEPQVAEPERSSSVGESADETSESEELLEFMRVGMANFGFDVPPDAPFEQLAELDVPNGTAYAFQTRLAADGRSSLYLLIAFPFEGEQFVYAFELGSDEDQNGQRSRVRLGEVAELELLSGFIRTNFTVELERTTTSQDPNCPRYEQQEPHVREDFTLFCTFPSCAAVRTARTEIRAGFERECDGGRTNLNAQPFRASVTLEGGEVRIHLDSGSYEEEGGVFRFGRLNSFQAISGSQLVAQ